MVRRRILSGDEAALWDLAMRDVKPLARVKRPASPRPAPAAAKRPAAAVTFVPPPPAPSLAVKRAPPAPLAVFPLPETRPLNHQWSRALKKGALTVDASVDLHGLTEDAAHRTLLRFVTTAAAAGLRTLLVVTGKGRAGQGVLKARLPQWLAEGALRGRVLAVYPAHVKDGGGGAFYVVLRRLGTGPRPGPGSGPKGGR